MAKSFRSLFVFSGLCHTIESDLVSLLSDKIPQRGGSRKYSHIKRRQFDIKYVCAHVSTRHVLWRICSVSVEYKRCWQDDLHTDDGENGRRGEKALTLAHQDELKVSLVFCDDRMSKPSLLNWYHLLYHQKTNICTIYYYYRLTLFFTIDVILIQCGNVLVDSCNNYSVNNFLFYI